MRLINARNLKLEEFDEQECPSYAILSHRWEEGEVTYLDATSIGLDSCDKRGVLKIRECSRLSIEHDVLYAWVDTCCIDKSSSAELSEAINSMFRWYQNASICIAYLSDVGVETTQVTPSSDRKTSTDIAAAIQTSLWFTRAWTLQELIAPDYVAFYDTNWRCIGSKTTLAAEISERTGIPEEVLKNKANIFSFPVAQRMSWARNRQCRRLEDTAYSLLGIFDVNMPLLYGEGRKAFHRLQEEIIKTNNDHTIFLWSAGAQSIGRLLAPSPDYFSSSLKFQLIPTRGKRKPFSITNLGLSITLPLIPWHAFIYLALLDCEVSNSSGAWQRPGLYLRRLEEDGLYGKMNFSAGNYGHPQSSDISWRREQDIFIVLDTSLTARNSTRALGHKSHPRNFGTRRLRPDDESLYGFVIRSVETLEDRGWKNVFPGCKISTEHQWDPQRRTLEMQPGTAGFALTMTMPESPDIPPGIDVIKLGFDFRFRPCCVIRIVRADLNLYKLRQVNRLPQPTPHAPSIKTLQHIALNEKHKWSNYNRHHAVPPSDYGVWLLKGDPLLGMSVTLGLHEGDSCFCGQQVKIRLNRERVRGRMTWAFYMQISPCPGDFCSSHEREGGQSMLAIPALIVTPPSSSPWSMGIDAEIAESPAEEREYSD